MSKVDFLTSFAVLDPWSINNCIMENGLKVNHNLKIKVEFAELYFEKKKFWELRKNDRDFKEGDIITFTIDGSERNHECTIVNVFDDVEYGLKEGYCILSLRTDICGE